MQARFERLWWGATVPAEARSRRFDLAHDFQKLISVGLLPQNPGSILDMGSGSGAGSIALRDTFPQSQVTAIDNADNWQFGIYKRKTPPSDIHFFPVSMKEFAPTHKGQYDVVIAARICLSLSGSPIEPWNQKVHAVSEAILTLISPLKEQSVLALSWPTEDLTSVNTLIEDNLHMESLFDQKTYVNGARDTWAVWSGFNPSKFQIYEAHPDGFLTDFARENSQLDPYNLASEF
jgi:trans-aconitate methyltransferase